MKAGYRGTPIEIKLKSKFKLIAVDYFKTKLKVVILKINENKNSILYSKELYSQLILFLFLQNVTIFIKIESYKE